MTYEEVLKDLGLGTGGLFEKQEALIFELGEMLSKALEEDGRPYVDIARACGWKTAWDIKSILQGRNVSLRTIANLAHGLGKRVVITFEDIDDQ